MLMVETNQCIRRFLKLCVSVALVSLISSVKMVFVASNKEKLVAVPKANLNRL